MSNTFKNYYNLLEKVEQKRLDKTIEHLSKKKKILLISTSNRPESLKEEEVPKSMILARYIQQELSEKTLLIDAAHLTIHDCTGHVSFKENDCGVKAALLKDKDKNPSNCLRCWTSFHMKDDELWKIVTPLLESDAVVFFGSVRWGQMNAVYQRIIERLSWLESRHTTLSESNIIKDIDAGIILTGQNWNGENVLDTQKQVLKFYGFKVPEALSWNWQFTKDKYDESLKSYKDSFKGFEKDFDLES
jgi:multimeric flavodoxin WrbA